MVQLFAVQVESFVVSIRRSDVANIKIGPEFFKKAKNDYSDWIWALVREFMQNCMDCGSKNITVEVSNENGNTRLVVTNDGRAMSKTELVDKLLSLGSSGKEFHGTVGGFGKAKEILYLCHEEYLIFSGNCGIVGCGAEYTISPTDYFHGTRSSILLKGDKYARLLNEFAAFARLCYWKGTLRVNGNHIPTDTKKGTKKREFDWGTVYTTKQIQGNRLVVRIQGIPMFTQYLSGIDKAVIIELPSSKSLTSNRDGLTTKVLPQFQTFISDLTVNKLSALKKTPSTTYVKSGGKGRLCYEGESQPTTFAAKAILEFGAAAHVALGESKPASTAVESIGEEDEIQFLIKNESGKTVPNWLLEEGFSEYASQLVYLWSFYLLQLHRLFKDNKPFSVGFLLDITGTEAQFEMGNYGRVFYINPISMEGGHFRRRWKFDNAGVNALLADAVHEFTHARGCFSHDEVYTSKLTDNMGKVLANIEMFQI